MPSPGSPKDPSIEDPLEIHEADVADPGDMEKIKLEQQQSQSGKYGSVTVEDEDPSSDDKDEDKQEEKKKVWFEFKLIDASEKEVSGEKAKIKMPDGSEKDETTSGAGIIRVPDIEEGQEVSIRLVDRFDGEWKFVKFEK